MKASELLDRAPTMRDVKACLRRGQFEYLDLDEAAIMHPIRAGQGWIMVIGERDNAAYEWSYVACEGASHHTDQWTHSNKGYGSPVTALRDGLIHAEGITCPYCHKWHADLVELVLCGCDHGADLEGLL